MPPRPKSSSSSSPRTENPDIRESMRVLKVPRDVKNLLSLSCERRFTRLSVRMPMPFNTIYFFRHFMQHFPTFSIYFCFTGQMSSVAIRHRHLGEAEWEMENGDSDVEM